MRSHVCTYVDWLLSRVYTTSRALTIRVHRERRASHVPFAVKDLGVLFVFIQGPAFLFIPLVGRLIHRVAPRWVLTGGFALMAVAGLGAAVRRGVPGRMTPNYPALS